MHQVYGFEAPVSNLALPHAHLLVDILSEWPEKTRFLKEIIDRFGGNILFRLFPCFKTNLCDLCRECPKEERENAHKFLETIQSHFGKLQFRLQCELATFVTRNGSALFEKKRRETCLFPHLRLKYK